MDDEAPNEVWPHLLGGGGGGLDLLLTHQADDPLSVAFGEVLVEAPRARLDSPPGHVWPPGLSLPTPAPEGILKAE